LARRLEELEATVVVLGEVDLESDLERLTKAAEKRVSLAACEDIEVLRATREQAVPPKLLEADQKLRILLARLKALRKTGQVKKALQLAQAEVPAYASYQHAGHATLLFYNYATILFRAYKFDEAQEQYELAAKRAADARDDFHLALAMVMLASIDSMKARVERAKLRLEHAELALRRYPGQTRKQQLSIEQLRAKLAFQEGRNLDEVKASTKVVELGEELYSTDSSELASLYQFHAISLLHGKRHEEAMPWLEKALRGAKATVGEEHPTVANILSTMQDVHAERGDLAKAKGAAQKALQIRRKALGPEHPMVGLTLRGVAELQIRQKEFDAARASLDAAKPIIEKGLGAKSENFGYLRNAYGKLERAAGRPDVALRHFRAEIAHYEEYFGPHHQPIGGSLQQIIEIEFERKHHKSALKAATRLLAMGERGQFQGSELAEVYATYARAAKSAGERPEVWLSFAEKAAKLFSEHGPEEGRKRAEKLVAEGRQ
jgi:tetratricopeptide (TPR) repeat protein